MPALQMSRQVALWMVTRQFKRLEIDMGYDYTDRMTHQAQLDIAETASYISQDLANPSAATAYIDELLATIDEACQFPYSGAPVVNEYVRTQGVRMKLIGSYIMFYLPWANERVIEMIVSASSP